MRRSQRQTTSRFRLAPILLVAFILVPLAEIALLIQVGGWLGLMPTLALIILTAVIGTWMLRQQGFTVLSRAQRQLEQGVMPVAEVFEGLCLLVAGVLLLTPGFITDACARAAAAAASGARAFVPSGRALSGGARRAETGWLARGGTASAAGARRRLRGSRCGRPAAAARRLGRPAMILVRHAESEWNRHFSRTRIDPGIPDPALTEDGRRQAEQLRETLRAAGVTRLIASPYRRALETASIVADALDLPIAVEALVRERCVFSCDLGTPRSRLTALWPGLDFSHLEELWWGGPDETEASLAERCVAFRVKTDQLADRREVAVITHWGFIRAITGQEVTNATLVRLD